MNAISIFTNNTPKLHLASKNNSSRTRSSVIHTEQKRRVKKIHTPGSWPARIPKNPVVPTTVKRKAACTTKIYVTNWTWNKLNSQEMHMLCIIPFDTTKVKNKKQFWKLTSFLTLGIARFSAFLIPKVVSSRIDVWCTDMEALDKLQ